VHFHVWVIDGVFKQLAGAAQCVVQASDADDQSAARKVIFHAAKRPQANYLWTVLMARIYEVFPLLKSKSTLRLAAGRRIVSERAKLECFC
jgi:hypothetical protein